MNINFYVVVPAVVLSHLIAFGIGLVPVNNIKHIIIYILGPYFKMYTIMYQMKPVFNQVHCYI